ncbi:Hypothetical predicted protein [Mytilus galloprovincialis]|uniref:Uncharacterized protein n=1 Tax=Mytilus galloprovincialis TaxID=29158 RepID=A0A8B6F4V3_MYTGA|nr:Hypothetical predicted protein [Mytilus galloprovincialis]
MNCSLTNGEPPLCKASQNGQVNVVKRLSHHSANVIRYNFISPLLKACYNGHVNVVKELLERDDVDINLCDNDKSSPLFGAILEGHENVVTEWLQNSATVDNRNDIGVTPTCIASQQGHVHIVKQLLQHSADVVYMRHF